jgi:hypothetical protein
LATLRELFDETLEVCRSNPSLAHKIVDGSEESKDVGDSAATDQLLHGAACVAVARAMINLDEFITRE